MWNNQSLMFTVYVIRNLSLMVIDVNIYMHISSIQKYKLIFLRKESEFE